MSKRSSRWFGRWWVILLGLAAFVGGMGLLTVEALGLRHVDVDAEPYPQPPNGFDVGWWDSALGRWVHGESVDYGAVIAEESGLRRFVATLARFGPSTTPERFPTEDERLAYYINAYNALTLLGVVEHWPIDSVQDVRGWLEPRAGFGFFYGLRFPLDGDRINLYDLENSVIRGFRDARIHAAINCASQSCPRLVPNAFEATKLDTQLDAVTAAFCSRDEHVRVEDDAEEIQLSAIFDWYRPDFEEHARRLGRPPTVLDFILAFARPATADAVSRARDADYEVVFRPYDWSLNRL